MHTAMQLAWFADCSIRVHQSVSNGLLAIVWMSAIQVCLIFECTMLEYNSLHCAIIVIAAYVCIVSFALCYAYALQYLFQYAYSMHSLSVVAWLVLAIHRAMTSNVKNSKEFKWITCMH